MYAGQLETTKFYSTSNLKITFSTKYTNCNHKENTDQISKTSRKSTYMGFMCSRANEVIFI